MAVAVAVLGFAPRASAYTSGQVQWLEFPTLRVANDGHHFTGVTAIGYG
jgi:hypothetical protein